jgi:hypothetical protein
MNNDKLLIKTVMYLMNKVVGREMRRLLTASAETADQERPNCLWIMTTLFTKDNEITDE